MLSSLEFEKAGAGRGELSRLVVNIDNLAKDVLGQLDELARTILAMIWSVVDEVDQPLP
jgi:hypothetical protein